MTTYNYNSGNYDYIDSKKRKQNNVLILKINGFFEKNLTIREAKKYIVKLKKNKNLSDLAKIFFNIDCISYLNKTNNCDVIVNSSSIKTDKNARVYIQQNSLLLTDKTFLDTNLTLRENIKIVSLIYAGYDLSNASIASFSLTDIADKKIKTFTQEQRNMAILSYTIACPAIFWIIDGKILKTISEANRYIFNNTVNIRTRHGGAILIIDD